MTAIELTVDVDGTAEEVWRAVATGPGISSWYVPHVVEERTGGAASASFGDAPEMQIAGRVVEWDPSRRIVFDGGEDAEGGLSFAWTVEPTGPATCAVRLVNDGFGEGAEQEAHREAMRQGWQLFLTNLQLHCRHFAGQDGVASLPMAMWPVGAEAAWNRLTTDLGLAGPVSVGDQVRLDAGDGLGLAGTVLATDGWRLSLLLDGPAPGTAFLAAEGDDTATGVSVWSYLYGPDAAEIAARDKPRWQAWLDARA